MSRFKALIVILILIPLGGLQAQSPQIARLEVNEGLRQLRIVGQFGKVSGTAFIGGVQSQIFDWSDSVVRVALADSGSGSSGEVYVESQGANSNKRTLIRWSGTWKIVARDRDSAKYYRSIELAFGIRLDLLDLLTRHIYRHFPIELQRSSTLRYQLNTLDTTYGQPYRIAINQKVPLLDTLAGQAGFVVSGSLNLLTRTIDFQIDSAQGFSERITHVAKDSSLVIQDSVANSGQLYGRLKLDVDFYLRPFHVSDSSGQTIKDTMVDGKSDSFPKGPPDYGFPNIIGPQLVMPINGAVTDSRSVAFVWLDTLGAVKYEFLLSKSRYPTTIELDSVTTQSSLVLDLAPGKYYWRVRGYFNEWGFTGWSALWDLQIGSLGVSEKGSRDGALHQFGQTISLPEYSGLAKLTVFDLLGRVRVVVENPRGQVSIASLGLWSGEYFVMLKTADSSYRGVVIVYR